MSAIENFSTAIRANHGLAARHLFSTPIRVKSQGETVWEGIVEIFEINHPEANRCYAWKYETDDGRRLVATVLGVPEINSSRDAVQAHLALDRDPGPE